MNATTPSTEGGPLHARFDGPIVMIGFGSIGKGTLPLIERHIAFDRSKFVVIAPDDSDRRLLDERQIRFIHRALTKENYRDILTPLLTTGPGRGMVVNLSVDTSSVDLMEFSKDLDAFYIDTVVEPWPGLYTNRNRSVSERSNYALREGLLDLRRRRPGGVTAVSCCGANPGMVSWMVKQALASFEGSGNLWWACRTIAHLSPTAIALGDWDAGIKYCRRHLEYGATLQDLRLKVIGLWRLGATYIHQGDPKRGLQYCEEALALGPLPYDAAMVKAVRGYGQIKAGLVDAGIEDLSEASAWFENFRLQYTYLRYALWLAEAHLRRADRAAARPLLDKALTASRSMGYAQIEGLAWWLIGECLAAEAPAAAEPNVEAAMGILERIGARNDLARAMITRAALRQRAGDVATARALLDRAQAIFHELGTLDEPTRVEAGLADLDRGAPIALLASGP